MTGLIALTSGSTPETVTFGTARYRSRLRDVSYSGADPDLSAASAVWVPEGTPRRRMRALIPGLDAVLARGGAVLMFGDQQAGWPRPTTWRFRPAGGAGQTSVEGEWAGTEVGAAAQALHHHGVLEPPADAEVLLAAPDGAAVAYLDRPAGGGTILVSTIDPLAHFGTYTCPLSARFLDAFLPWVSDRFDAGPGR
ncbi:MAG: hypothetical protein ACT4P1_08440 [Sporichthyaceae bacterium]